MTENVSSIEASLATLYATYSRAGHTWAFIVPATVLNLVAVPGIFMNASIIYVTAKYKSLRGSSCLLLALTAFYDILHAFGHLLFLGVALSGANFVDYGLAFKFLLVPLVGECSGVTAMALTGLDRLLQVTWPKRHNNFDRGLYMGSIGCLSLVPSLFCSVRYIGLAGAQPQLATTGLLNDVFIGDFHQEYYAFMFALNTLTIAFYVAVWAVVRKKTINAKNGVSSEYKTNSRLFKSLICIICINIGGYYATSILSLTAALFPFSEIQLWHFECAYAILLNLGVATTAPILYFCSSDYKTCFSREIGIFLEKAFGISLSSGQIAPTMTVVEEHAMQISRGQPPSGATPNANLNSNRQLTRIA